MDPLCDGVMLLHMPEHEGHFSGMGLLNKPFCPLVTPGTESYLYPSWVETILSSVSCGRKRRTGLYEDLIY